MSRPVRRGVYRRRCARCGWEGTYTTAGRANYAKRKHSCTKREDAMVRAAQREAREALVDRTPKPCLHKYANHQHGERATYVLDACRCIPCSKANAEAETWRTRQKAYGRYHKYVPAEHVRAHLRELGVYGIGLKRVAKLSGVSTGTLSKIMFGVYAPVEGEFRGCKGKGERVREPSRRVLRSTAEKIYDVEAVPANLGVGQKDHERTPTARLRLQALVALGWSQSKLAERLGILPTNLGPIIGTSTAGGPRRRDGLRILSRGTVDKIEALYAELSMTLPPETNHRERIAASRSRNYAAERGWLPPLALEDVSDVPVLQLGSHEDVDEVAVRRAVDGDKGVRLTIAERREAITILHAQGLSDRAIGKRIGVASDTVQRVRSLLGLPANVEESLAHVYDPKAAHKRRQRQEAS